MFPVLAYLRYLGKSVAKKIFASENKKVSHVFRNILFRRLRFLNCPFANVSENHKQIAVKEKIISLGEVGGESNATKFSQDRDTLANPLMRLLHCFFSLL